MNITEAKAIAGSLGFPSKMPGTSYGISAHACVTGSKLAQVKGSVCHGCYALKANYSYPSVMTAHIARLRGTMQAQWVDAMVTMLLKEHGPEGSSKVKAKGHHRWHDSGDIQSVAHLTKICEVAVRTPKIKHWLPTRELKMVLDFIAQGGVKPSNMCIRVSATMVDGSPTKAWPVTSTVHTKVAQGRLCPAPTQGNECGSCRACWSNKVKNVSYHLH